MNIGVAYDDGKKQVWLKLEVTDGSTVKQVIEKYRTYLKPFTGHRS